MAWDDEHRMCCEIIASTSSLLSCPCPLLFLLRTGGTAGEVLAVSPGAVGPWCPWPHTWNSWAVSLRQVPTDPSQPQQLSLSPFPLLSSRVFPGVPGSPSPLKPLPAFSTPAPEAFPEEGAAGLEAAAAMEPLGQAQGFGAGFAGVTSATARGWVPNFPPQPQQLSLGPTGGILFPRYRRASRKTSCANSLRLYP